MDMDEYEIRIRSHIGEKYGKLTVERVRTRNSVDGKIEGNFLYECRCECGNIVIAKLADLKKGFIKGCSECDKPYIENVKKNIHYRRARMILDRCNKSTDRSYYRYGGRGIRCELGETAREVVHELMKVPGYFDGAQIDRIDNDGNYTLWHPIYGNDEWIDTQGHPCRGNLRWVTSKENNRNRSNCISYEALVDTPMRLDNFRYTCLRRHWDPEEFLFKKAYDEVDGKNRRYYCIHKSLKDVFEQKSTEIAKVDPNMKKTVDDEFLNADELQTRVIENSVLRDPMHGIASALHGRCTKPYVNGYAQCGAIGIKSEIGNSPREILKSLKKLPGYFKGACVDRIDPNQNYTFYHPKFGYEVWYDEKGRPCLGNCRWVPYKELQSRRVINDRHRTSFKDLYKIPRSMENIRKICVSCGYKLHDFVFIGIDNTNMSHRNPILYRAFHKSILDNDDDREAFNDYRKLKDE